MKDKLKEVFLFGVAHSTSIGIVEDKNGGYNVRYSENPIVKIMIDDGMDAGSNRYHDENIGSSNDSKNELISMICESISDRVKFDLKNGLSEEMINNKSFQYVIFFNKDWFADIKNNLDSK